MKTKVICYSGYKAEEKPIAFFIGDRKIKVKEIIETWYQEEIEPERGEADCFKVIGEDEREYCLCYLKQFDEWIVIN
ncbi:MAG: hypothetical protein AB1410_07280 [Acidobacteriota bacterium]